MITENYKEHIVHRTGCLKRSVLCTAAVSGGGRVGISRPQVQVNTEKGAEARRTVDKHFASLYPTLVLHTGDPNYMQKFLLLMKF